MVKDNSRMALMYKQRDSHNVNGKYVYLKFEHIQSF